MKQTRTIMSMPIIIEINDAEARPELFGEIFSYFTSVDEKFSTYKATSEISAINRGELSPDQWSADMQEVFARSEETKHLTGGYFNILTLEKKFDPSGLVKGWAIFNAAQILKKCGVRNFYVEAGGDIEVSGVNAAGQPWRIGIENPFKTTATEKKEIVKTVQLSNKGIATSGSYKRGRHIYDPVKRSLATNDIVSLTVIGPNIYEADRFATAAFAMGHCGIEFIGQLDGFEGYQIDKNGIATMTKGFRNYTAELHV